MRENQVKRTFIYFWSGIYKELGYKHGEQVDWHDRYPIVEQIMCAGYNVMLRQINSDSDGDKLIIFIDKGRFVQS